MPAWKKRKPNGFFRLYRKRGLSLKRCPLSCSETSCPPGKTSERGKNNQTTLPAGSLATRDKRLPSIAVLRKEHPGISHEFLNAPVNLTWEITGSCNLSCAHCLSAEVRKNLRSELDFQQCVRLIDELDRLKIFQINFGGGEPFLREDFPAILRYAHSKGIVTCVSTNGTVLDAQLVATLKSMDLLYIQVSLDGATEETNDRIRGKGTYNRILRGIEILANHSIPNFSINMVVTRLNFQEIHLFHELARNSGAKTRLSRFRPVGNGKEAWDLYHLDKDQLQELSLFLDSHKEILTGDSFFSIAAQERRGLGMHMCGAARMTCSVSPDGAVYPCAFLQDRIFLAGNVTQQSLELIWRDSAAFHMIRNIRVESCESCSRFNFCHGGCPAVAYYLTKSLHYSDPECMATFQEDLSAGDS
jgi:mycofactocin radical SAM maturase